MVHVKEGIFPQTVATAAARAQGQRDKITKHKRKASSKTIKRDILVICISHYPIMSGEVEFVSSEFDIFAHKPIQSAILGTCGPLLADRDGR